MLITRHRALIFLKGMAMGAADSVPGVSGGTVALITNIYEQLVDSIKSLGWHVLVVWRRDGFMQAWRYINGDFLVTLLAGILTSLLILGNLILHLMDDYLPYLLAFFAGLVLASIRFVGMTVSRWTLLHAFMCLVGIALAVGLSNLPLQNAGDSLVYFFLCGAIAICAMILPGISGAFILVLLGAYGPVLEALTGFNWPVVMVFAAGCACGLMLFSRVLSWLLHHHHGSTLSTLTGMLVGSLTMLWPWQLVTELDVDGHSISRYAPVLPDSYSAATGLQFSPLICLGLALAGISLVLLLEYVAGNLKASATDEA